MLIAKNNLNSNAFRYKNTDAKNNNYLFCFLKWSFGAAVKCEMMEILYFIIRFFVYAYLTLVVISFFFQPLIPQIIIQLLETFADPYMGAIGVYFVFLGLLRRRGKKIPKDAGEIFFVVWLLLLVVASGAIYFSSEFHFDRIYNLIMKNSLAAMIFRVGMFIR